MLHRLIPAAICAALVSGVAFAQTTPKYAVVQCADPSGALIACGDGVVRGAAAPWMAPVATANTSQVMIPANASRRGWNFQNQTGGVCYWKIGAAATQNYLSFRVPDGGYYETPGGHASTAAVNVICANAGGVGYYATEW